MSTQRFRMIFAAATVALMVLVAPAIAAESPSPAPAASESPGPSGSPPEEEHPGRPQIEAWLDHLLPPSGEAGNVLEIGALLWDRDQGTPAPMGSTIFVRIHPAEGDASPITATARQDWEGHFTGRVTIPEGGLGLVEFGITGTVCENDVCGPSDWIFPIVGTGPPHDAPLNMIGTAAILPPAGAIIAGELADVSIHVTLNVEWDRPRIDLPPDLTIRAREPGGPNIVTASLPLVDAAELLFGGAITIPEAGDVVLEAAIDADGGDATRFGTSMTRVVVEAGAVVAPITAGDDEGLPLWLVIVMVGIVVVGGGFIAVGFRAGSR